MTHRKQASNLSVIVAGHICVDIIPRFQTTTDNLADLLIPGTLINMGPVITATGGAVSNTGLALHQLGVETQLMGKVGDDLFGGAILDVLRRFGPALVDSMIIDPEAVSSYTIVLNPPGVDRIFLHCPGANDTFGSADIPDSALGQASLFHFGYPPLMQRFFEHDGTELEVLMRRAKAAGLVTSLDVSYPDASSPAGQADWPVILERTLPHVDLYLPSLEETLFMLDRTRHDAMLQQGPIIDQADGDLLIALGERLLALGVAVAGLKLGDQGLYVRTSTDQARFASLAPLLGECLEDWVGRELLMPCFAVDVAGTTGAGDTTIAGFLTALLHGSTLADALTVATGAGACSVEQADASSGVPPWGDLLARIDAGWRVRNVELSLAGWHPATDRALWYGPNDHQ